MLRRLSLALLALALVTAEPTHAQTRQPVAVIANALDSDRVEIPLRALRQIYLGKLTRLDGVRLEPLHLQSGTPPRHAFSIAVLGKPEEALQDYWIEQALTGGRVPPREVPSVEALVRAVARRPGALGYAPLQALRSTPDNVRILRVVTEGRSLAPSDPGYPIRLPRGPNPGDDPRD